MEKFFVTIYGWIYSLFHLYHENFDLYLWGYDPAGEEFSSPNIYNQIGLITLVVSLVVAIVYFYVINHPRASWWSWILTLLINSIICLVLGWLIVQSHLISGRIPDELLYRDDTSEAVLGPSDCFFFGVSNFFVATLFFVVISLLINWWSSNAKFIFRKKN